jgi:HD-GYP domain-containing protein (c-di-GMP phosphodiesterase class II)
MNEHTAFLNSTGTFLKQIDVDDLKVGMYVAKLDRPWLESTFLFQGFVLKNQADINAVKQQCKFVFIDELKQSRETISSERKQALPEQWIKNTPPKKLSTFEKEAEKTGRVYHQTSSLVKSFMDEVRLGGSINVALAEKTVAHCVDRVLQSPDAMMWMTQLKNRDLYTSQHSMNVAVLAIALGRHLNLPVPELNKLGLCGMMHDMGKMSIPLEILNKPGKFTPEELAIMRSHAEVGWKLLMSTSGMYPGAIDVAYSHHEKLDGTGYPRQLTAEQTTPFTKIVTIVDIYDAITSDRVYQKGRTHLEAINVMTKLCGTELDSSLTYKFIECMGIYPPGSVVEMTNGEVAIVAEVNQKQKIKPKIILVLDEHKQERPPRFLDLAKLDLDASGQSYGIRKIVRPDDFGIDLNLYYESGLIQTAIAALSKESV